MTLIIAHRRTSPETLRKRYGDVSIVDVTSQGREPWIRFSPFYPHGNIPVPFSSGYTSMSVEGIWQGLKVFERSDVDISKFAITDMKGMKRSTQKYGQVLGHRRGIAGDQLLAYKDARYALYLPSYHWVLDHFLDNLLLDLRQLEAEKTLVLLDYETNCSVEDTTRPLSHAGLIKLFLEKKWPAEVNE